MPDRLEDERREHDEGDGALAGWRQYSPLQGTDEHGVDRHSEEAERQGRSDRSQHDTGHSGRPDVAA
jgi:hypothetical protein